MALELAAYLEAWLAEDLIATGPGMLANDVTSLALIGTDKQCRATITCQANGIISGITPATELLKGVGCEIELAVKQGTRVKAETVILKANGPAQGVLAVERLVLNLLGRLSGIATATAEAVKAAGAANPGVEVAATRKTTPGLRTLEKQAVTDGGGAAHRQGLYDAFLIKDNHLALMEGSQVQRVRQAVKECRKAHPELVLEVEADTAEQAIAAAQEGVDWLLLDNFTPAELARISPKLRENYPELKIEISGGVSLANVVDFAPFGDRVSMGWLTQSAPALPFSLHVKPLA